MKPYKVKNLIQESEIKILKSVNSGGSQRAVEFDKKQSKIILDYLKTIENNSDVKNTIDDTVKKEKYSSPVFIQYGKIKAFLYSYFGIFRLGGDGKASSKEDIKKLNLDDFINSLKSNTDNSTASTIIIGLNTLSDYLPKAKSNKEKAIELSTKDKEGAIKNAKEFVEFELEIETFDLTFEYLSFSRVDKNGDTLHKIKVIGDKKSIDLINKSK